jgi:hypothetical protein
MDQLEGQPQRNLSRFEQFHKKWRKLQKEMQGERDATLLLSLSEDLYTFLEEWEWETKYGSLRAGRPDLSLSVRQLVN